MRGFIFTAVAALLGLARGEAAPANKDQEAAAGIPQGIAAAYFAHTGFVFAIDVVKSNGDVWYHMNAPSSHSWYGVGFGSSMNNVRMLVSYLSANGHNITNSCRMSYGDQEPVHDPACVIENISTDIYGPFANTISPGATLITHSVCRGCASWMGGALDLDNTQHPFIYALGPNITLHDDSPAANLQFHNFHGSFNLDMTKATNYTGDLARVPAPQDPDNQGQGAYWSFGNSFSSPVYNTSNDTDWAPMVHGIFMILAFLVVFPLGAVILRTMKRAMAHAVAQLVGMAFVLVGFGFAVYISKIYVKSRSYTSAHQVIGLLILATLCIQIGLGFTHHFIYLRTRNPTVMGQIHRFLGIGIILLALINAGVGWNFAGNRYADIPYGVVAGVLALLFAALFYYLLRGRGDKRASYRPERHSFVQDYKENNDAEAGEYEMHDAPFASMGVAPPERTPRWMESNNSLRGGANTAAAAAAAAAPGSSSSGNAGGYSDQPDRHVQVKNPMHDSWQPVSGP